MNNKGLNAILASFGNLAWSRVFLVAVAATAVYYFMFYDPGTTLLAQIDQTRAAIQAETNKRAETEKILKEEEMMKANVGQTQRKFEEVKNRIPIAYEETDLLSDINDVASRNSLRPGTRTRESNILIQAAGKDTDLVEAFGWRTSFTGTFVSLVQFAIDISELEKVLKIGDFRIIPAPNSTSGGVSGGALQMETTVIGYRQKPISQSSGK